MNGSCKFSTGIREDILVSFVSIIISVLVNVIYFVLFDRFIMGAVQRRSGPYIVGWFGLLQSIADGIKL